MEQLSLPGPLPSKRCPRCQQTVPLDDFVRNRGTKDGRGSYCKPCHNDKIKEIAERLYGGHRNFLAMKRYGMTVEQIAAAIESQGGLCAICRKRKAKHVDHSHKSSEVREVLCFACNRGLGKAEDDAGVMRAAIAYLHRYKNQLRPDTG